MILLLLELVFCGNPSNVIPFVTAKSGLLSGAMKLIPILELAWPLLLLIWYLLGSLFFISIGSLPSKVILFVQGINLGFSAMKVIP